MKLLIDMNLSPMLCPMLAEAGYEARHWSSVGDPRAADPELLSWAKRESFVLVTHDLDFGAILAATGFASPSVVQIRRRDISPESLIKALTNALSAYHAELENGALVVVDEIKSRVRILPIGQ
jgi:predicted nuclease of predicted toxin-antitoxin system